MGQTTEAVQPRLLIHRVIRPEITMYLVMKLMETPDGPTFTIRRREDGHSDLWMSKRTYDALNAALAAARETGEWE